MSDKPDFEEISKHLFSALTMCQHNLRAKGGSGMIGIINRNSGKWDIRHWREIVADALEKMPGVTVDRDMSHALDLPKKQREKFFKDRESASQEKTQQSN